jgi:RND family efflux transporter MFP subunit
MMRKYLLPAVAMLGAICALFVVFWSGKKEPPQPIPFPPPSSPYAHFIAGAGIVEASSENISIGSPFSEIVTKVYVVEGDRVKIGDPLFHLDLRSFEARLATANEQLRAAEITYENQKIQFNFYERLQDKRAVSEQAYQQAYYALQEAEAQVKVAQAVQLQALTDIERSIIRAPVDGEILQVVIHVGEIAPTVPFVSSQSTLVLMGTVQPLQIRIDIDEDDAWRFIKGSKATAFVRGNSNINFPLQFLRVEPYIIPKASFTGDTTERIDTRVLQVLYRFEKQDLPIYAGQILDVFIESPPLIPEENPKVNQKVSDEVRFGP